MALNRLIDAELDARNPRTAARELPMGLLRTRRGRALHRRLAGRARARRLRAQRALPLPVAHPGGGLRLLSVHEALHGPVPLRPGPHRWPGSGGRLGRRQRPPQPVARPAVLRRRPLGGRLRRHLRGLRPGVRSPGGRPLHPGGVGRPARAMAVAAVSHAVAVALLFWVGAALHLPSVYFAGCGLVALLLAASHVDIAARGLRRVGMAFMTANGVVSVVYFAAVLAAVLAH